MLCEWHFATTFRGWKAAPTRLSFQNELNNTLTTIHPCNLIQYQYIHWLFGFQPLFLPKYLTHPQDSISLCLSIGYSEALPPRLGTGKQTFLPTGRRDFAMIDVYEKWPPDGNWCEMLNISTKPQGKNGFETGDQAKERISGCRGR